MQKILRGLGFAHYDAHNTIFFVPFAWLMWD